MRERLISREENSERASTSAPGVVLAELGEDQRGLPRARAADLGPRRGDPEEAGHVAALVLDPLAQHDAAVQVGRGASAERGPGPLRLAHHPHRRSGAADASLFDRGEGRAQEACALAERLRMGENRLDVLERHSLAPDQVDADAVVVLADDRHRLGFEGQGVERGTDRALDRVLDRHQRAVGFALLDREDRVGDRRRPQRLQLAAGHASRRASSVKVPAGPR